MTVRQLKGMGVVSLAQGDKVGSVDDVLVDPATLHVTGLILEGASGKGLLPLNAVKNIGKDAITVDKSDTIQWGGRAEGTGRTADQIFDLKVVDAAGTAGGTIHDIVFDPVSGAIASFDIRTGGVFGIGAQEHLVPVASVHGLGASLLTVESLTPPGP